MITGHNGGADNAATVRSRRGETRREMCLEDHKFV